MNDLTIENAMVIGDYYRDGKVARAERLDDLIRDAEFLRSWDWLDWIESEGLMQEFAQDLAAAVLNAKTPEEAGAEARAVLLGYIEDYAEDALESES